MKLKSERTRGGNVKRLVAGVLTVTALLLGLLPGLAAAQEVKLTIENVAVIKEHYPTQPAEEHVKIYAGEFNLKIKIFAYSEISTATVSDITTQIFLDNSLVRECKYYYTPPHYWGAPYINPNSTGYATSSYGEGAGDPEFFISKPGAHEILIQVWHGDETQPQDTYGFSLLVVKPEVSNLQASSKVVRALGENSLNVSFTNGGNTSMRQAVLSVADSGGLTLEPGQVELGDIDPGETASASFKVSAPATVPIGTARVSFHLSFIDYAGVQHEETEDVYAEVEVYRLSPTLTLSLPSSVENGNTVSISATLKDPEGNPIPNENIGLSVGGVDLGVFKTGTDGVARASYTATETGALDVEASFPGSASYDVASDSGTLTVTPATSFGVPFPSWVLPVILIALVFAVSATYLKRRKPRQGRKTKSGKLSCSKCGAEIPGNSAFCPFCGTKLRGRSGE